MQVIEALGTGIEDALAHGGQVQRFRVALEQRTPVGAVGHLAAQQVLDQPGLLPGGDAHDRQGLAGTLIEPACGQLGRAGDTDLDAGRVGEIDHVVGHAELRAPVRIAAGAELVVAFFRADNAGVALGQLLEAGIAVTLAETLVGLAPAVRAVDRAQILELQPLADQRIHRHPAVAQAEVILSRGAQFDGQGEQAGVDRGLGLLALGAAFLAAHEAGALFFGQVFHFPDDHRRQAGFLLLLSELAPIAPFAEFNGLLEVLVDFRGDVFDGFDKG